MSGVPVAAGAAPSGTRWWVLSLGSLASLIAVYWLAVRTYTGQRVENAALRGALQVNADEVTAADQALATVTVGSLALAVVLLAVVGWVRGGLWLASVAVAVVGLSIVVTEALKRYLLPRPDLVDAPAQWMHNSFPSGHTTVAMSVALATLLVVSWRWRTPAMLIVMFWSVGVGAYTVVARWHRLSDTLGADAVALGAASIGALVLLRTGRIRRVPADSRAPVRTVIVVIATTNLVGTIAIGAFIGWAGMHQSAGETADYNLYLAAQSIASGGSLLAIVLAWWSWHRLESVGESAVPRSGAVPGN